MNAQASHTSKTRLLDAALTVIRTKGYSATTVDDICQEAGVTKGSFFHHFKSKDELALGAADHFSEMADGLFATAPYRAASDPLERLLGYIDFRAAMLKYEIPQYTCLLGTMVQEAYETSPRIRQACETVIGNHAAVVARDLAAAKKLHVPDATWDPLELALFTQVVIQGAFVMAKAQQDRRVASDSLDHLHRYVELLFSQSTNRKYKR